MVPMERTGPPLVLRTTVPEARSAPAPRNTTPLGTLMVDEPVYVPARRSTTWFLPLQPSRALWIAEVASPPCTGTVAHAAVRTGNPSGPSEAPVGVSERIPGFQLVVKSGSRRPGGALLHALPPQLWPPLPLVPPVPVTPPVPATPLLPAAPPELVAPPTSVPPRPFAAPAPTLPLPPFPPPAPLAPSGPIPASRIQ